LHAAVEQDKVVDQLQEALFVADLAQVLVQLVPVIVRLIFFPPQPVFFWRERGAVLESLTIIPCKKKLHGCKEPLVEYWLLVREALPDAIPNTDAAVFQLNNAKRETVDVQHEIRPALVVALERGLLRYPEVVIGGVVPVDELDGLR